MSRADLLLHDAAGDTLRAFFEPRARAVDCGEATVRESVAFIARTLPLDGEAVPAPDTDLTPLVQTIATIAWSDMSSAFSLWCHRMVLEYLALTAPGSWLHDELLPRVRRVDLIGSTALAAGMAHAVTGARLPVCARRTGGRIVLDGQISWASNLFPPELAMITAAEDAETGRAIIVAVPGDAPGLDIAPYPHLFALNATGSSSITVRGIEVGPEAVITDDFTGFIRRVRPPFLLMQSSFCWGLTRRALDEATRLLGGITELLADDLAELEAEADRLGTFILTAARDRGQSAAMLDLVRLRFDSARLTTAAVALEAKAAGGRGYVSTSATARRLREAQFLPIQAPTEAQLRWELSRSASAMARNGTTPTAAHARSSPA